jgi:hypothetical protein
LLSLKSKDCGISTHAAHEKEAEIPEMNVHMLLKKWGRQ